MSMLNRADRVRLADATVKAICMGAFITVGYVAYVVVTHGDGIAFGAFCAAIGTLGGYLLGKA